MLDCDARGDVAQLGEHRVRIAGVRGSSPLISTTIPRIHPAKYAAVVLTTMRARDPRASPRPLSARAAADEPPVSANRQDAGHEVDQVQDREGGTAGTSEGEAERASV